MPTYETVFAVPANLKGEEREKSVKEAQQAISSSGGEISASEEIGEKEMAYKVKGHTRAYYHMLVFDAPAGAFKDIKDYYRFNDAYIRSLTVKKDTEEEV